MAFLEGLNYSTEPEPKGSRLNLPSIADMLGLETDNRFLNWQGIFGGEPKYKVDVDSEVLESLRKHHRFMSNMTGMGLQALPFVGAMVPGVIKGVSPTRGRAIRQRMSAENMLRGSPTGSMTDQVARGLWLHGRGTYPAQGESFAGARAAAGNLGEPHGLSLTADKALLRQRFAKPDQKLIKQKSDLITKSSDAFARIQEIDILERGYEVEKGVFPERLRNERNKLYNQRAKWNSEINEVNKKQEGDNPFARVFPKFGGKPEDKILKAWVAPDTVKDQQVLKDAYLESAKRFGITTKKLKDRNAFYNRTWGSDEKYVPSELLKIVIEEEVDKEAFNKSLSGNLRMRGYRALQYSPERYGEYEMRMLDPNDVLMLDMRTQEDPALERMYEEGLPDVWKSATPDQRVNVKGLPELQGRQKRKISRWKEQASPREGASLRNIYETITWEDIERILGGKPSQGDQLMNDLSLLIEEADTILAK